MKRLAKFSSIFIILLIQLQQFVVAQDWPYWRGPDRNGISNDKNWDYNALNKSVNILWQINVGPGYSSVSVKDDYLYTSGGSNNKDIVYCLNVSTGETIWTFKYDNPTRSYDGSFATPVIDENKVYTFGRNGDVYCLDAKNGQKKWFVNVISEFGAQKPKYGYSGSPVVEDNIVLLNAGNHGIALDKNTGETIWASPPGKAGYATPVIYSYEGKKSSVVFSHRRLNGVELSTGKLLWSFPWVFDDGADSADPVVVGNKVFISTAYRNGGTMIEFTANNPKQHWFKKDIQDEFGSSIYINGYLYVPVGDTRHPTAYLKCIDFNTGEEMWSRDTGHCSIINADGKFIVLNQRGELTIMEASEKGYNDLSRATVVNTSNRVRCWTAPVLANGKIFVRTNVGDLVCVDVSLSADEIN